MGTITIKNLSTLDETSALLRVALFIDGSKDATRCPYCKSELVKITKKDNTYTITDMPGHSLDDKSARCLKVGGSK